ncbi:DUF3800 domain-containing protein [Chitinimonas sp. BJB300]|uniref:DUF3800 domain-containing protein n=1 Tax=Chitinimonas sp. BJB300 TaxID=1559339 RepID=UPI000C0EA9EF|nr:DUF3800 domain-containing protein [Chitinimonas sp. BJB300]PHV09809.1 hypothetical protein CSQ89_19620 [Chitinimonas sp. BJB300]TSJ84578.1 DUF3800 domain-containing protein [Chitinimonas sp. BJB300]
MAQLVYVDESGDLGWSFDKPYGQGGSSRYLTIAAVLLPESKNHLPERKIRQLYKNWKWDTAREKKWVDMPDVSREAFARSASNLALTHADIEYRAIVVAKERVQQSLRADPNKLYNWMLKLLLLDKLVQHERVVLVPDPRSIKVSNGKMLDHYLEMALYEKGAVTHLEVTPLLMLRSSCEKQL